MANTHVSPPNTGLSTNKNPSFPHKSDNSKHVNPTAPSPSKAKSPGKK